MEKFKDEYIKKLEEKSREHKKELERMMNNGDQGRKNQNLLTDLNRVHEEMLRKINEFKEFEHSTKDEVEKDYNHIYSLFDDALKKIS